MLRRQVGYALIIRVGFDKLVISDLGEDSFIGNVGQEARFQGSKKEQKVRLWRSQI